MPKLLLSLFTSLIIIFGFSFAQADTIKAEKYNTEDTNLAFTPAETNGVVCDGTCPECMKSAVCNNTSFADANVSINNSGDTKSKSSATTGTADTAKKKEK